MNRREWLQARGRRLAAEKKVVVAKRKTAAQACRLKLLGLCF